MNYTLTDTQQAVLEEIAKAEMRSVSQMMALLIAEGISWTYVDYSPRYGDVNTSKLEDQVLNELKDSLLINDQNTIT
jgi:predicted membrane protein